MVRVITEPKHLFVRILIDYLIYTLILMVDSIKDLLIEVIIDLFRSILVRRHTSQLPVFSRIQVLGLHEPLSAVEGLPDQVLLGLWE